MRKLEPITDDTINFIKDIIGSSRKSEAFKRTCSNIVDDNILNIEQYDTHFQSNTLERLEDIGEINNDKDEFKSLYDYNRKQISNLRNTVLTQNGYRNDKCPLCECDSVGTMDHYLPKEKYPLFVVHPRNLIPCCNSCNQHKSHIVFEGGQRMFWNCYLDEPINTRYLYCSISTNKNGLLDVEFYLDCSNLSEKERFLIENTMNKQKVLEQYDKQVRGVIDELVKKIYNSMVNGISFSDSIQMIKKLMPANILNDWKDVLEYSLLNSDDFLRFAEVEAEKYKEVVKQNARQ